MYRVIGMLKSITNNIVSYNVLYNNKKHRYAFLDAQFFPIFQQLLLFQSVTKIHERMCFAYENYDNTRLDVHLKFLTCTFSQ